MRVISGVMATSGTERSTIAIGMKVASVDGARLNTSAHDTATEAPANRPTPASVSVVIEASQSWSRASAPICPVVR